MSAYESARTRFRPSMMRVSLRAVAVWVVAELIIFGSRKYGSERRRKISTHRRRCERRMSCRRILRQFKRGQQSRGLSGRTVPVNPAAALQSGRVLALVEAADRLQPHVVRPAARGDFTFQRAPKF